MTDPGFPRRGRQLLTKGYQPIILAIFPANCVKLNKNWSEEGAPQIHQCNCCALIPELRRSLLDLRKGVLRLIHTGHQNQGFFRNMSLDNNEYDHIDWWCQQRWCWHAFCRQWWRFEWVLYLFQRQWQRQKRPMTTVINTSCQWAQWRIQDFLGGC